MRVKRGRFAPSPSGLLHIGNAMTALFAWLQTRQANGEFILRIEDLDGARSRPQFSARIVDDLRWLGLDWDEGPDVGGSYGPYVQSERNRFYEAALDRLNEKERLYPCFCSRAELNRLATAPHGLSSEGPVYPGTCKGMTMKEQERRARVKTPSIRFAIPDIPLEFHDLIQGPQCVSPGAGGDFIVKRADGIMAYQLAVVVDDAAMNITDVVRGADLLDSTARQLWLYDALDLAAPKFGHTPLLADNYGQRLSKRNEHLTLQQIRKSGRHPELVIGCLAYLSGFIERVEEVSAKELIAHFSLDPISSTSSVRLTDDVLQRLV